VAEFKIISFEAILPALDEVMGAAGFRRTGWSGPPEHFDTGWATYDHPEVDVEFRYTLHRGDWVTEWRPRSRAGWYGTWLLNSEAKAQGRGFEWAEATNEQAWKENLKSYISHLLALRPDVKFGFFSNKMSLRSGRTRN
jgi:hypothetical protein